MSMMHLIHMSHAPSYLTDIVTQISSVTSRTWLQSGSSLRTHTTKITPDNERFPTRHRLRGTVCRCRCAFYV